MRPCQGRDREFESRRVRQIDNKKTLPNQGFFCPVPLGDRLHHFPGIIYGYIRTNPTILVPGDFRMPSSQNRRLWMVLMLFAILITAAFPTRAALPPVMDHFVYLPLIINTSPSTRKINIPYFGQDNVTDQHFSEMALFWFGRISPSDNYSDVRIGYNDTGLVLLLSIFDRLLWYDPTPSPADLTRWDSVTLYLARNNLINENAYRFTAQINSWEPNRLNWQLSERGSTTGWNITPLPFTTTTGLRWEDYTTGGLNNNQNNRGWVAAYSIPFTSLGLSSKPVQGAEWNMALVLHDRDDANGTVILENSWPEDLQPGQPSTWGRLHFGLPSYTPSPLTPAGTVVIRNKLNGAVVPDAAVGGTTGNLCPGDPQYIWNNWANENYGSSSDMNIQNQSDLADWPCFSKYYVNFPLNSIPANKIILSATLTLYHWGNSGTLALAQPSYIHVYTVDESWNESAITWNTAPLAYENVSQAWVDPAPPCGGAGQLNWPCTPRSWDLTRAAAEAYQAGKPLSLALYSSDQDYHSGKFFTTSNVDDWDASGRPTLVIKWGNP